MKNRRLLLLVLAPLLALVGSWARAQATPSAGELFVVEVPAGDSQGFSIDFTGWSGHGRRFLSSRTAPALESLRARTAAQHGAEAARLAVERAIAEAAPGSFWLDRGFSGVVFRGQGPKVSHVRPPTVGGPLFDVPADATILVDRHDGVVRLESLTVHAGERQAVHFGLAHKGDPILGGFRLELARARAVADPPPSADELLELSRRKLRRDLTDDERAQVLRRVRSSSTVWGLFGYQADATLEDVELDFRFSTEHASYWHGFARDGIRWTRVQVTASGAEGCKVRNDPTEIDWVGGARIVLVGCRFRDWYQPWTWRGGAAVVLQGSHADLLVDSCVFEGGQDGRSRCVMVDDGGGNFYDWATGERGVGHANGRVVIRRSGFFTGPGTWGLAVACRVGYDGRTSAPWKAAVSWRAVDSVFVGPQTQLQLSGADSIQVVRCNAAAGLELAARLGFPTSPETVIPLHDRLAKVSEGLTR